MKFLFALLIILLASGISSQALNRLPAAVDSIGHKWENGKLFVLHKVDKGQTAFAISRRYGVSVDAIRQANGGSIDVKVGQVIRVPYSRFKGAAAKTESVAATAPKALPETAPALAATNKDAPGTHTVEVGNTLYNIATRYGVSVADVKAWNGLKSDQVMLGQVLIISSGKFTESNQAPKVSATPVDSLKAGEEKAVKTETVLPEAPKPLKMKSVRQQGLAEKIDVGASSPKFLALHRSAPIGTLIQVTNQSNQEVIWAKVIGRIPDTSINEDIVIKLSGSAFDKISPQTRRFRAEVTYSDKAE